jgi:hypothetical protein
MIRVYATENATQRGNSSTAAAGTVASAIRFLAKAVMTGDAVWCTSPDCDDSGKERGHAAGEYGIGRLLISRFLVGVQGVSDSSVREQLANLKASGDYSRIIKEVGEEIERENREALAALAKAEKEAAEAKEAAKKAKVAEAQAEAERKERVAAANAKAKQARDEATRKAAEAAAKKAELDRQHAKAMAELAEKRRKEAEAEMAKFDALRRTRDTATKATAVANAHVKTFDFEGVAKHLKSERQVRAFRQCVTAPGIAAMVNVKSQAGLAKKLAQSAKTSGLEFTGQYIRDNIGSLSGAAKHVRHRLTEKELADQEKADAAAAIENRFKEAGKYLISAAYKIKDAQELVRKHKIKNYAIPTEFRAAVESWAAAVKVFSNRF